MNFFRNEYPLRFFTALSGFVFLNLSFFLAELNAFEFNKKDKVLYEALLVCLSGINDEERDPLGGEAGSETESLAKVVFLFSLYNQNLSQGHSFTLSTNGSSCTHVPCDGALSKIHQPPESIA